MIEPTGDAMVSTRELLLKKREEKPYNKQMTIRLSRYKDCSYLEEGEKSVGL